MRALCLVFVAGFAACSPVVDNRTFDAPPYVAPTVMAIVVTPDSAMLKRVLVADQQLTVKATYSDSSVRDVTSMVTWSSSDMAIATVSPDGLVTAATAPGSATITATFEGVSDDTAITVVDPTLVAANYVMQSIDFFPAFAEGATPPTRSIVGAATLLANPRHIAIRGNELFVTNASGASINVYPLDASGDVAPLRRIVGPQTTLASPVGIALSDSEIFVTSGSRILAFPINGNGDIVPTREIAGPLTGITSTTLGLTWPGDELVATGYTDHAVVTFAGTATGNIAPLRTITGAATLLSNPRGMNIINGELFVTNTTNLVTVYAPDANGDVAPSRQFTSATVSTAEQIVALGDEIYIACYGSETIAVFPRDASGELIEPTRKLAISRSLGIAIY